MLSKFAEHLFSLSSASESHSSRHDRLIYDVLANRLFVKIFLCGSSLVPLRSKTKDEPKMKKCLGWHFECCARRVPTLRKSAAHRIKKRTPKLQKSTFIKIPLSFLSLIPCLKTPSDDRETTERTPTQLPASKKALFLRLLPKKVDSLPENVSCLCLLIPNIIRTLHAFKL